MTQSFWRQFSKFFEDESGRVVLIQAPNPPLYLAIIFWLLKFSADSELQIISSWGVRFFISYWAIWEVFSGVSWFRRVLGVIVLIWTLSGLL